MPNTARTYLNEYVPEFQVTPDDYTQYIGKKRVEALKKMASSLEGKGWTNVNSTMMGGGVAEILRSIIPFARSLGIDANWKVINGRDDFFKVTKKFHNMLQGIEQPISLEEIFHAYLNTIDQNACNTFIASDLVVIHDPQPAAMVMNGVIFGNVLWRCHIDTSTPNTIIWRFLLPYINQCAGAVFTMPEFAGCGLQIPLYQITPCIDPLSEKNKNYTRKEALHVLQPLFNEHNIDPGRPILAAVSRYDMHKNQTTILRAFKRLREVKNYDPRPYLIFMGNTATDDPEGEGMLKVLRREAGDDPDVHFFVNIENNDKVVGALMHLARALVHVSTREGFGLVASEAMWQSTPVIGSCVGGIKRQVINGKTGFLVDPLNTDAISKYMSRLIDNPEEARYLGKNGKRHVRDNFLLPELIRRYLKLLAYYTCIDTSIPEFRINEMTYSEVMCFIRPGRPYIS